MGTPSVIAPDAPARMGQAVDPTEMVRFLEQLGAWRARRHTELDEIDRAARAAPGGDALIGDLTLSMTLWQSVATRYDELVRVWDGGRVGEVERLRLSALVWGRLDTGAGPGAASLAVSLPEACRLSDALAAQLRQRLALDPLEVDVAAHLRAVRATLERVRDLVPVEPAGPTRDRAAVRLQSLDGRLADVTQRAQRGADVGGQLGPLDAEAALVERDLIVAAATRRDDERDRVRAQALRAELINRTDEVTRVVDECVARVLAAPTLAVPQVESLGPVPDDALAVDAYLVRLGTVARALAQAERAYRSPLTELDDLRALLDAYHAKAVGTGRSGDPEVAQMHRMALDVVSAIPADLARARAVVAAFQTLLGVPTSSAATSGRTS